MVDEQLEFGRYQKQVDYRNGRVDQVLEYKTENLKPNNPRDIELVANTLRDMLIESLSGGYKSLGVEVELKSDKTIKVIKKTYCRRLEM